MLTLPVSLCTTHLDTVTVAVLFIKPALVTSPWKAIGGMMSSRAESTQAFTSNRRNFGTYYVIRILYSDVKLINNYCKSQLFA
jgi:hypothetical protein